MSAAAAPRLACEPSAPDGTSGPRANRRDVDHNALGRTACQVYGGLCDCLDYSRYTGLVWPKVGTLARRLHITERTVQRGLEELVLSGWVGTPFGDVGGSREGLLFHLHPNGRSCLFCVAAARTLNQRGKRPSASATGDILTPHESTGDTMTPALATGDKVSPVRVDLDSKEIVSTGDTLTPVQAARGDILAARGDKNDSAYKERRSLKTLSKSSSTTTRGEVPLEFAELMTQETQSDRGALLRLWRETREILPDATSEEIRHWFHERGECLSKPPAGESNGPDAGDHPRCARRRKSLPVTSCYCKPISGKRVSGLRTVNWSRLLPSNPARSGWRVDGRCLVTTGSFSHCYAVTDHRSQGKTVDFGVTLNNDIAVTASPRRNWCGAQIRPRAVTSINTDDLTQL